MLTQLQKYLCFFCKNFCIIFESFSASFKQAVEENNFLQNRYLNTDLLLFFTIMEAAILKERINLNRFQNLTFPA